MAAEQYGLYNLSFAAVEIAAGLAACGLGAALVRYIPIYRSRQDENRLWGTIQIGLILPALVSLFLSIALYILAIPIAEQWFEEPKLPLAATGQPGHCVFYPGRYVGSGYTGF
ncbi:MAG: oligosaccharide flippase family protein [Anaerolineales bacterium]|nr:oligosaccharide flippase family protein [Anaerolineales bacterium]